jgi:hypothetical protein
LVRKVSHPGGENAVRGIARRIAALERESPAPAACPYGGVHWVFFIEPAEPDPTRVTIADCPVCSRLPTYLDPAQVVFVDRDGSEGFGREGGGETP